MQTIKFRGVSTETGKVIYSKSIKFEEDGKGRKFYWLMDEFGNWLEVDTESVRQFVGYDMNGEEIYIGDVLQTFNGVKERPPVKMCFGISNLAFPIGHKLCDHKVKEDRKNEAD